ncbi:MAG TPA: glycerophosphodiester phosphodiesterase [Acidimicrobiales bacterium]|nr:glycerophosphodiester phosphodiesterase [Acidimicrobiales bacterium]
MNPWLTRRVIAFAHQGGSFEGPSSTLYAIDRALRVGATAIELDVHATSDRQLVVCHDETVDRTTNHHGSIAALTLAQLREMDNAYWWIEGATVSPGCRDEDYTLRGRAPRDSTLRVATLEEVVTTFPGVVLNLDIKQSDPDVEPYEELLANELTRLGRRQSVMVASFHDGAIQRFRSLAPEVATSAATQETASFFFSLDADQPVVPRAQALQVPARFGETDVVTTRFVEVAHASGLAVHVWTINDRDEMERLLNLGVDGLITDRPALLASVLASRGGGWSGEVDEAP